MCFGTECRFPSGTSIFCGVAEEVLLEIEWGVTYTPPSCTVRLPPASPWEPDRYPRRRDASWPCPGGHPTSAMVADQARILRGVWFMVPVMSELDKDSDTIRLG